MKTEMHIQDPDKVEVTMTTTMTLGEWRVVSAMLPQKYGSQMSDGEFAALTLSEAITGLVSQMEARVSPRPPSPAPTIAVRTDL